MDEAKSDLEEILPQRMQQLIDESGVSLRRIGEAVGISKGQLIQLKEGRSQPRAATILALARYFEVEPGYFYALLPTPEEIDLITAG